MRSQQSISSYHNQMYKQNLYLAFSQFPDHTVTLLHGISFFRDNFLIVDVYFAQLKYQYVRQIRAYNLVQFMGRMWLSIICIQLSVFRLRPSLCSFPTISTVEDIKSVPSVCVSVVQLSHTCTVCCTDPKISGGIGLDNISDQFDGRGHRMIGQGCQVRKRDFLELQNLG